MSEIAKGYKKTEIGVIPEDWDYEKLGDLITYTKGFAFKSKDYRKNGVRIIRVSDTTYDSIKDEDEIYIDENEVNSYKKWQLKEDDIIISTVGSKPPMYDSLVGKTILVKKKYEGNLLNQNAVLIRTNDKSLDKQRIIYVNTKTKNYLAHIEKIFRGNANQASITIKELFDFKIPLPKNPEEQTAIAEALSDTDSLISSLEKLIDKKKKIKEGAMQELLTGKKRLAGFSGEWEVKRFGELITQIIDNRGKTPRLSARGFGLVEVNAIYRTNKYPNYKLVEKFVEESVYKIWFRDGHPQKNDILIATVGSVGVSAIMDDTHICIAQNIIGVSISKQYSAMYIFYWTKNSEYIKQIKAVLMGAVQPSLKLPHLLKFSIKLPPTKEEQTAIAEILSDMDSEISSLETKLEKYKQIKQGMMQELLTGRIRLV